MGVVETAAAWVARALEPLTLACGSDDDDLLAFVAELGWDLPRVPPALRDVHGALAQVFDTHLELVEARWRVDTGQANPAVTAPVLDRLLLDVLAAAAELHGLGDRLRAELPAGYVAATGIDAAFEIRVYDWLICTEVARASAVAATGLRVLGVLDEGPEPADPARHQPAYVRRRVRWDMLLAFLRDPGAVAAELYGWGTSTMDGTRLTEALLTLSFALVAPGELRYPEHAYVQALAPGLPEPAAGPDPELWVPVLVSDESTLYLTVLPVPTRTAGERQGVALTLVPAGLGDVEVPLGADLTLRVEAAARIGSGAALVLRPGRDPVVILDVHNGESTFTEGRLAVEVRRVPAGPQRPVVAVRLGAEASGGGAGVFAEVRVERARLVFGRPAGDGLLARLIPPGGVVVPVTAAVQWSGDGLRFAGAAGLETALPLDVTAGPLRVRDLRLGVTVADDGLAASATVTAGFTLGPVEVALVGFGVRLDARAVPGNLGPFDLDVAAVLPTGAELALRAGAVTGGGTLRHDPATGRYSGALAIRLNEIAVDAYGLLDTRLPGGGEGFSLLVMLSARFPGIPVGFGVLLTGVGGLVGVNRRLDVDALRERFASGTAGRILAPADPGRDLPALLAELAAVFPPADGVYVVGPTVQLRWAKLVTLDVGVFLEFPGPTRVAVLGTARASLDHPLASGPLLRLRCDFVGVLDLARGTLAFDAVLVDSRLLERFPVTGGLMLRAGWGAEPYALLSVGGFHPEFAPGSLPVPRTLTRLAMSSGSPEDRLYLRFEGYLAITPNTVQFGASVEVAAKLGPIRVRGFIGFDALIRFEPFYFQIAFEAGMTAQWRGRTLLGLGVRGTITGPGPVRFTGRACIEVLFFDICASATFELGSDAPPRVDVVASALDVLAAELRDPANLRAVAEDRMVVLGPLPAGGLPVLPPGGIVWEQTRVPLGLLLERFEGSPLARPEILRADGTDVSGEETDWFAPGGFAELTDAEALTRRSFERLPSGVRIAAGADEIAEGVPHEVRTVEIRLPAPSPRPSRVREPLPAPPWLAEAVLVREARGDGRRSGPAYRVHAESWQVVGRDGRVLTTAGESHAHQLARARRVVALPVGDHVALTDL